MMLFALLRIYGRIKIILTQVLRRLAGLLFFSSECKNPLNATMPGSGLSGR